MSEKKHELYLIALALVISAGLILYIALDTPEMNAVKTYRNTTAAQTAEFDYTIDYHQSETAEETAETGDKAIHSNQNATAADISSVTAAGTENTDSNTSEFTGIVNINTAIKEQLMTLDGIGEVKAMAIIDYRRENGNFRTVDELMEVEGIGEKTLEKIRNSITV